MNALIIIPVSFATCEGEQRSATLPAMLLNPAHCTIGRTSRPIHLATWPHTALGGALTNTRPISDRAYVLFSVRCAALQLWQLCWLLV